MNAFKPWPDRVVRQNTCMNTRACAVLVPIIYKDGQEQVVFEVRSSKLGSLATSVSPAAVSTMATTAPWQRPSGKRMKNSASIRLISTSGALWITWNRL